ncbi:hypothetical protein JHL18_23020 [Clostridium sp. YIM B02505]|uniref:HTH cro/C1-type domain-containing protein n=1 Tax=Clostridium yunnanense TaxID=2800325 RepID=A0ABS1EVT1_9CLOT|nr:helix-turn-helix transcriptional regulator [Clostridium yunnanense]MBK1813492.1 hypothetical protein [Clostridium yunnanense]
MNFYDPGAKIRLMRKRFHMNQAELEDSNMTRAFISMMESGKRRVSRSSSKILAEKFNEKGRELGLELKLDDDYFSREPYEDARVYCSNELMKDNNRHGQFEELLLISSEFNLDDITAEIYKKDADKYFEEVDYSKAFINYSNSLGKLKELKIKDLQTYVYKQMGVCKLKRNEYDDAIFYFNQALYYAKELGDEDCFVNTSYNLALTYFDMQKYNESIEILDKYVMFNDNIDRSLKIDSRVLKANSFYKQGKRKEAIADYFLIIEELAEEDQYLLAMLYSNLGEYYYENDELQESIKYINLAQKIKNRTDKSTLPYVLNIKGKVFFKQGLVDESMMIMELAMNMAEEYSNYSILFDTYKDLINIYESIEDIEKIKDTSLTFLSVLDKNSIDDGRKYALTKLVEVELRRGNTEEAIKLLAQLGSSIENH